MKRLTITLVLLMFVVTGSNRHVISEDDKKASYEHLMKKIEPYTNPQNEEKYDRDKAEETITKYISNHKKELVEAEKIKIYQRLAQLFTSRAPSDFKWNERKASRYTVEGLMVSGIKFNKDKIDLIGAISAYNYSNITPAKKLPGYHQFLGFIQTAPEWFLSNYIITSSQRNGKNKNIEKLARQVRQYSATIISLPSYNMFNNLEDKSREKKKEVERMYMPYTYLLERRDINIEINTDRLKEPEYYRKKLKEGPIQFSRNRLNTMHNLGLSSKGVDRFRWLTSTHLICGFLQNLPEKLLKQWIIIDTESRENAEARNVKEQLQSFRNFCKKKQKELARYIYTLTEANDELKNAVKILYAPAAGFKGNQTTNEAQRKIEKIYRDYDRNPLFEERNQSEDDNQGGHTGNASDEENDSSRNDEGGNNGKGDRQRKFTKEMLTHLTPPRKPDFPVSFTIHPPIPLFLISFMVSNISFFTLTLSVFIPVLYPL